MKKAFILLVPLLLSFVAFTNIVFAQAEPKITVSATPNPLNDNESLHFKIEVTFSGSTRIDRPSFIANEFDIVGQSNSQAYTTKYINGKMIPTARIVYSYVLYPKKTGLLKISNINLSHAGKTLRADDVLVNVKKVKIDTSSVAKNKPNQTNNPSSQTATGRNNSDGDFELFSDFTIRLKLNKRKVYVGEPLILEYYLYDFGGVTQIDIQKWPNYEGFWKEDLEIPMRYTFQNAYVGSKMVRKVLLGKFALYPLKPGKYPLGRLVVGANVRTRDMSNSPFGAFGFSTVRRASHASQEESIEVLPLPQEGASEKFSGGVGNFNISLKANKQTAKANEAVNFKFTISGTGNFHAITEPNINFPDEFELFETSTKGKGSLPYGSKASLHTNKVFDYLVIPRKAGEFVIPPVKWEYFDVEELSYKIIETGEIKINITPSEQQITPNTNQLPNSDNSKKESVNVAEKLRYLKSIDELQSSNLFQNPIKLLIKLFILLNFVLFLLLIYRHFNKIKSKITPNDPRKAQAKKAIQELLKSKGVDYNLLDTAINMYTSYAIGLDTRGMTKDELKAAWKQSGAPYTELEKVLALLDAIYMARFASKTNAESSMQKFNELKQQLKDLINSSRL